MKDVAIEAGEVSKGAVPRKGMKNLGLSIMDHCRCCAVAMGTTQERLPFATLLVQFRAEFDDPPSFLFFVLANSIICGYLAFSLILSIFHIVRTTAMKSQILLVVFDNAMTSLVTAAASAAAAIVYTAHKRNPNANWFAICQQYNSFCERISGSLIGSFIAVAVFIILIIISAVSISRP